MTEFWNKNKIQNIAGDPYIFDKDYAISHLMRTRRHSRYVDEQRLYELIEHFKFNQKANSMTNAQVKDILHYLSAVSILMKSEEYLGILRTVEDETNKRRQIYLEKEKV
jgi:hypothetical protein